MTDITIPPEAVEAGCSAYTAVIYRGNGTATEFRQAITAAIHAALAAWPGMGPIRADQPIGDWCDKLPAIILPLPQEKTDVDA